MSTLYMDMYAHTVGTSGLHYTYYIVMQLCWAVRWGPGNWYESMLLIILVFYVQFDLVMRNLSILPAGVVEDSQTDSLWEQASCGHVELT